MGFGGIVEQYERDENGDFSVLVKKTKNIFVDDGKEAALDALLGYTGDRARADWWDDEDRYVGYGICCFDNKSFERASGMNAIPLGSECSYPVETTLLASPDDSFLSREVGNRVKINTIRRDQTVEMSAIINVPGDIPVGTPVREFAIFCKAVGPFRDPSHFDDQKPMTMICRTVNVGTGYYTCSVPPSTGLVLCYFDDPWIATDDRKIYWKFGEL